MILPISSQYPKYTNSSYNSISKKPPNQNIGRRPEQTFFFKAEMANEKMLNILLRYHLNCQNGYHQKVHKSQMLARMWTKGNPCILLLLECKLVQSLWKPKRFLKKLKTDLPNDPEIPLMGIIQKKQKHELEKIHTFQRSGQHYL